jgi:hypothetical protein
MKDAPLAGCGLIMVGFRVLPSDAPLTGCKNVKRRANTVRPYVGAGLTLVLTLPLTENEGFSPEFIYERARLRALSS